MVQELTLVPAEEEATERSLPARLLRDRHDPTPRAPLHARAMSRPERVAELARPAGPVARSATVARGVLLDALARELRTTLALVSGYSQTLLHLELEDADRGRYLARITAASDQVAELSEEMLAVAAAEDGDRPEPQPVALGSLLGQVGRSLLEDPDPPRLDVSLPLDLPLVQADPIWLRPVLRALIADLGRQPGGGEVVVEARPTPDAVVVTVSPGVSREATDGDDAVPSVSDATIALCVALVEAHGGRVWRETRRRRGGASFALPRYHRSGHTLPGWSPAVVAAQPR